MKGRSRLVRVGNRITSSTATVLIASLIAFVILRVLPGDPAQVALGSLASKSALEAKRIALGLDQPVLVQYARYIWSFLRGDWGYSYGYGAPVRSLIAGRLAASLELAMYTFFLVVAATAVLALFAVYRGGWADRLVRWLSFLGLGTPPFWLGIVLLLVFAQHFHWLPGPEGRLSVNDVVPPHMTGFYTLDALIAGRFSTFLDAVRHLVLPVFTLWLPAFAFLVRLLRANLLEVTREPFLTVAQSKGLTRWGALWRHGLPNGVLPTLTGTGLVLAEFFGGSVLVERVFNWPGVGNLIADSISRKDFSVVQTFILLSAVIYVMVNLVVDLLYGVVDPRTKMDVTT